MTANNKYATEIYENWDADWSICDLISELAYEQSKKGDYSREKYLIENTGKVEDAISLNGWDEGCKCSIWKAVELAKERDLNTEIYNDLDNILKDCAKRKCEEENYDYTKAEWERIENICENFDTINSLDDLYNEVLEEHYYKLAVDEERESEKMRVTIDYTR